MTVTDVINTVKQGASNFMATYLLAYIDTGRPTTRAFIHDAESFAWVFIYTMYKHALRHDTKAEGPESSASRLTGEFMDIFSAPSFNELMRNRFAALGRPTFNGVPQGIKELMKCTELIARQDGDECHALSSTMLETWYFLHTLLIRPPPRSSNERLFGDLKSRDYRVQESPLKPIELYKSWVQAIARLELHYSCLETGDDFGALAVALDESLDEEFNGCE